MELQDAAANPAVDQIRTLGECQEDALTAVFDTSEKSLRAWPGRTALCNYLERRFQDFDRSGFASFMSVNLEDTTLDRKKVWIWFSSVASAWKQLGMLGETSIDDIWSKTHHEKRNPRTRLEVQHGSAAIFAALCWMTMILRPTFKSQSNGELPNLTAEAVNIGGCKLSQQIEKAYRRPIQLVFRTLRGSSLTHTNEASQVAVSDGRPSSILYLSTLNYGMLQSIGQVKICWVYTIAEHLNFDLSDKTLSVFRFPTFSALSTYSRTDYDALRAR